MPVVHEGGKHPGRDRWGDRACARRPRRGRPRRRSSQQVKARRSIEVVGHVLFAGPDQLDGGVRAGSFAMASPPDRRSRSRAGDRSRRRASGSGCAPGPARRRRPPRRCAWAPWGNWVLAQTSTAGIGAHAREAALGLEGHVCQRLRGVAGAEWLAAGQDSGRVAGLAYDGTGLSRPLLEGFDEHLRVVESSPPAPRPSGSRDLGQCRLRRRTSGRRPPRRPRRDPPRLARPVGAWAASASNPTTLPPSTGQAFGGRRGAFPAAMRRSRNPCGRAP